MNDVSPIKLLDVRVVENYTAMSDRLGTPVRMERAIVGCGWLMHPMAWAAWVIDVDTEACILRRTTGNEEAFLKLWYLRLGMESGMELLDGMNQIRKEAGIS